MSKLKVDINNRNFILDNKSFFYLADTVWSAFTNITLEEWAFYLDKRWSQGYTVLQINTLPQWDRCMSDINCYPFETADGHKFDFSQWHEAYYVRARKMCQMAIDKGFQLALVILWLNYVPGTWGSRMMDINVMPQDFVAEYTEKVVAEFDEFDPIYIVSGDTDFDTPDAIAYYEAALKVVCQKSPDSLKAMHIKRGYEFIPEQFLGCIDFYMFQSGHNKECQDMAYVLAENFYKKYPKKPIINAEPCYEQMGSSRQMYFRFEAYDIRKAAWSSILSGACAGVTYGAHGVWNWNKPNHPANPILGEGFDKAFPVQEALQFPGAWDYGFIKEFLDRYNVTELIPVQELLEGMSPQIRIAKTTDERYLVYMPCTTRLELNTELQGYEVKAVDLETRRSARVHLEIKDGKTSVEMHPFKKDAVLMIEKKC